MLSDALETRGWQEILTSILKTTFFAVLFYFISLAIYRLTLHPLAKYPGPVLAKITDLNNFWHVYKADRHTNFLEKHDKYGPVYRYGPNRLSFNTATALHDIYGPKANVQKSKFYRSFPLSNTFNAVNKVVWARKRRVISHAFSGKALREFESEFQRNIGSWVTEIGKSVGKGALDMSEWSTYLSFDIISSLVFGKPYGMVTGSNRQTHKLMKVPGAAANLRGNNPFKGFDIAKVLAPGATASRMALTVLNKKLAGERMVVGNDSGLKDFFHYLLEAKDSETGKGFEMPELWGESVLLIIAGSDTTATTIAAMFFYFTHYSGVLSKVKKEVRSVFEEVSVDGIKQGPELDSCRYLRACINEALRMAPPVPGPLPREVNSGGTMIDGHEIPAGVDVSVGTYALHHNKEYFPDPYIFRPERWIAGNGNSKESVETARSGFCPFSVGPRSCIGKNMAYMEMMLAMAKILISFDFELVNTLGEGKGASGTHAGKMVWQLRDKFNVDKDGPFVRFTNRAK